MPVLPQRLVQSCILLHLPSMQDCLPHHQATPGKLVHHVSCPHPVPWSSIDCTDQQFLLHHSTFLAHYLDLLIHITSNCSNSLRCSWSSSASAWTLLEPRSLASCQQKGSWLCLLPSQSRFQALLEFHSIICQH